MAIRRGTTDYLEYAIPFPASAIEAGYITFSQSGLTIMERDLLSDEVDLRDGLLGVPLSQEDTLALPTGNIKMQIRLRLVNGTAPASYELETTVDDVQKDGVI